MTQKAPDLAKADPHIARAAAEMMAGTPKAAYVPALLTVLRECGPDDTHLRQTARIALRNCLRDDPEAWPKEYDALYAEMGDPATDKERLTARSPLFHAKNIKKPLLVVQGANDPRVLKVESDEIVAAAKKNGAPVEYLVFEDEGHGFQKKKNQIAASEKYVAFLDKYLAGR